MSLLLATCSLAIAGFQQSGTRHRHIPVEMEFPDDPPALILPMGRSIPMILSYNGFVSVQVNVDGNQQNIIGDAANEPSLCVDPNDPNKIAIGWRQFDSVSSNFRQAGYGYTSDGGNHWTFPGKLENGVFRSDPVLGARYDSTFLYLSLLDSFYDDMWKSVNGGQNWNRIASADGGDKQWFTVDNTASVGRGFMYQYWSTAGNNWGGRQFTRSTDGGLTWLNPINIPSQPVWGTLDVALDGTMYLCGSGANGPMVVRSSNAKLIGQTPTFDLAKTVNLGGDLSYGEAVNPGGLEGQMWIAVDRSNPSVNPNPVYMLATIYSNLTNPGDVMFSRSLDGGSTWSAPLRVNDDPLGRGHYHWFGTLAVGPTGRIDAVWNDTRDDSTKATSSLYYSYSLDGGKNFVTNIRLTPSFNQSLGYPQQNKMGDYIGVVSNLRGANVAFTATFNGEEDVYYMNIPSPVVVAPTSFQVFGGGPVGSNDVATLASIDNYRLTLTGLTSVSNGSIIDLVVTAQSPTLTPKALLFNLVSKDTYAGEIQSISFYNWNTHAYEVIKTSTSSTSDTVMNCLASGDLTRFVDPYSGNMKADIRYAPPQPILRPPWTIGVDQAAWHVIP